jgi:DNA-binding phage protein
MSTTTQTGGVRVLTLEQIRAGLADRKLKVVAKETGLHYHTLLRIAQDEDTNPTIDTVQRISEYLTKNAKAVLR